jgi:hypothetical protein
MNAPQASAGVHTKSTILYIKALCADRLARCRKFACRLTATLSDEADILRTRKSFC